ncbi:MAG TPA: hydantoinase/oxoprolinase family protein, partial [Candidatus Bathyarchaeia archaeon]|nr:hydantoinase/oxoprolinase family protein [Candidatus Bathyarchaeia archaeon]
MFVGVDIGGTFTDLVLFDEENNSAPSVVKIPTTTTRPEKAVVAALAQNPIVTGKIRLLSHATTIGTNALLTRAGLARTALITNNGFRDILQIGRQRRPEIYNLHTKRPVPIVEMKDRLVVKERTLSDGSQQKPLDQTDLRRHAQRIVKARYSSVAISFLNSYANPDSEKRAGKILRESGFRGHIDFSSEVDPQYREYERTSTTVVNASLAPTISKYLTALKHGLERIGITCPVYVMNSDGTVSTASQASKRPVSMIESGPAAGVLSSKYLAKLLSLDKVITFDMGGTTAKAGTIVNGNPDLSYEFEAGGRTYHGRSIKGSGYPVRQPFIDLAEVSAGGGTIAWLDDADNLHVGPESAGAEPGPAAYGKGGIRATVTDANIVA